MVESELSRLALRWIPSRSRRTILRLARFLGDAGYALSPSLRAVGRANLDIAFGDTKSASEKSGILRQSFRSFALVMLDTFWFSRDTEARVAANLRLDPGFDILFRPKAQICITGHMGNWELLGITMNLKGFPLVSVAAPLANPDVDEVFNSLRNVTGQQILSKHGAIRGLLKTLKSGGKVALLLDQNTRPADGGVFVRFFGLEVPVASAAAGLWAKTGAELLVGACIPQPDGTYFAPAPDVVSIPPDADRDDLVARTQAITSALESWIRRYPQYWLWTYKRWKHLPPGANANAYPFYAKPLRDVDRQALARNM